MKSTANPPLVKKALDLHKSCRLCTADNRTVLFAIFDEEADKADKVFNEALPNRIWRTVGIHVNIEDKLPKAICHRCLFTLNSFYEFKQSCLETDARLRTLVKTRELIENGDDSKQTESSPPKNEQPGEFDEPTIRVIHRKKTSAIDPLAIPEIILDDSENGSKKSDPSAKVTLWPVNVSKNFPKGFVALSCEKSGNNSTKYTVLPMQQLIVHNNQVLSEQDKPNMISFLKPNAAEKRKAAHIEENVEFLASLPVNESVHKIFRKLDSSTNSDEPPIRLVKSSLQQLPNVADPLAVNEVPVTTNKLVDAAKVKEVSNVINVKNIPKLKISTVPTRQKVDMNFLHPVSSNLTLKGKPNLKRVQFANIQQNNVVSHSKSDASGLSIENISVAGWPMVTLVPYPTDTLDNCPKEVLENVPNMQKSKSVSKETENVLIVPAKDSPEQVANHSLTSPVGINSANDSSPVAGAVSSLTESSAGVLSTQQNSSLTSSEKSKKVANFLCFMCRAVFAGHEALRLHTVTFHNKPYSCKHCSGTFPSKLMLSKHEKSCHPSLSEEKDVSVQTSASSDVSIVRSSVEKRLKENSGNDDITIIKLPTTTNISDKSVSPELSTSGSDVTVSISPSITETVSDPEQITVRSVDSGVAPCVTDSNSGGPFTNMLNSRNSKNLSSSISGESFSKVERLEIISSESSEEVELVEAGSVTYTNHLAGSRTLKPKISKPVLQTPIRTASPCSKEVNQIVEKASGETSNTSDKSANVSMPKKVDFPAVGKAVSLTTNNSNKSVIVSMSKQVDSPVVGKAASQTSNMSNKSTNISVPEKVDVKVNTPLASASSKPIPSKHQCYECSKMCENLEELTNHIVECHKTGDKPIMCRLCLRSFNNVKELKEHKITHEELWEFSCSKCPLMFPSRSKLNHHVQNHVKRFPCTFCKQKFTSRELRDEHELKLCEGRALRCNTCDKTFSNFQLLNKHVKKHKCEKSSI